MASPQGSAKLFSTLDCDIYDVDADYTTAAVVTSTVTDMRDVLKYGVLAMSSALTGAGISLLEIIGCTASNGTGTITVIKSSGAVVADAVGDFVALECTAEELRQEAADAGAALRYCAVRLTMANAADEAVVTVIREPRFKGANKTATTIS